MLDAKSKRITIGFLVNPIAGAGGPAAHKGSDLGETRRALLAGEIQARSPSRALQFLNTLDELPECRFVTAPGKMGADFLKQERPGAYHCVDFDLPNETSEKETQKVVELMLQTSIDLLVFVGGDGTARDVCSVVSDETKSGGKKVPVLGVPSGVKMHSGVFAITPIAAACVLNEIFSGELVSLVEREVRDIDEAALQKGRVKSRYYGSMWVPDEVRFIQSVKSGGVEVDELVLADISAEIGERLEDEENQDALIIFATGSTTQFVQQELGFPGSLIGVDVVRAGALFAEDVSAPRLESIVSEFAGRVIIILTAIGGQGHILGRGNQQLTPKVLRRVGRENLWLVMTKAKLEALDGRPLLIDSNDPELDRLWQGLVPVVTGYHDQVLYRLGGDFSGGARGSQSGSQD